MFLVDSHLREKVVDLFDVITKLQNLQPHLEGDPVDADPARVSFLLDIA